MAVIQYGDASFEVAAGQSLLEAADQAGQRIPNSCRQGLCHSCLMIADQPVPAAAQQGLSEHQQAQGLFMACMCRPAVDLAVSLPGALGKVPATLIAKRALNASVVELSFETSLRWTPGQYITLWKDGEHGRAYSSASSRKYEGLLKLHIKRHEQGLVSRWCCDDLLEGQSVLLGEATGHCFYAEDAHDKPLLLAATGTGLAPLYAIVRDALQQGHQQPVHLYAAAGEPQGLYLQAELRALSEQNPHFHYHPVVRRNAEPGQQQGELVSLVMAEHSALRGWKVYLCGSPSMIEALRKRCFLAGASGSDILVDAFEVGHPNSNG